MSMLDKTDEIENADEERTATDNAAEARSAMGIGAISLATFGVGYIPLAPGTFGSAVGVAIYLAAVWAEAVVVGYLPGTDLPPAHAAAWFLAVNAFLFLLFCLLGIWAAGRATRIFRDKDPQKVVVDEVIGQLIVFFFVPFGLGWQFVAAGFLLFRLFDIWKPYPIDALQGLPAGIGVCADDILAGCYGGVCLSVIYAISLGL